MQIIIALFWDDKASNFFFKTDFNGKGVNFFVILII